MKALIAKFLLLLATIVISLTTGAQKQTNIITILIDDLGWSDLSCYGNKVHETPNIDKFAKESMMFTEAYSASPVCTPTRASIMTGKSPARLHMTIWSENAVNVQTGHRLLPPVAVPDLPLDEFSIAEVLKTKGYVTAHIGKWHLGESGFYPENQGFDVNIAGNAWGCPATFFYPYRGVIYNSQRYLAGLEHSKSGDYFLDRKGEYLTDRLTNEAIKILSDGVKTGKPVYLNLCYYSVHTPIEAPEEIVRYYQNKLQSMGGSSNPVYAAMVHKMDENVGRVLKAIDDLGIADNTIVVFTSDNGGQLEELGSKVTVNTPLRSGKGSLYEGGIRVPLIVRYPEITQPGKCNIPVISTDFYPTFCEIAEINTDTFKLDGISLVPLLKNQEKQLKRDKHYWHYPHYYSTTTPASAIRQNNWKLIKYYEDEKVELYNLKEDIGERNDVSKENPGITELLKSELIKWLEESKASFPAMNPEFSKR
jgi:arylsulfatase A-like enzyme